MAGGSEQIRTILEVDMVSYTDVVSVLERTLSLEAVMMLEDQVQGFVDSGLHHVGLGRDDTVVGTAGDNALLQFESAPPMHQFAAQMQRVVARHNARVSEQHAERWFRMGAATGPIIHIPEQRRIVGSTIARAVRLEAAAQRGGLLIDAPTYVALPADLRSQYGGRQQVRGKRDESFEAFPFTAVASGEAPAPAAGETVGAYLLLDYDGVIRPFSAEPGSVDSACLQRFEAAVQPFPDVGIVLASGWRKRFSLEQVKGLFTEDIAIRIVGSAPASTIRVGAYRHVEMTAFLDSEGAGAARWIAVDDSREIYPDGADVVVPDSDTGFDGTCAARLAGRLGESLGPTSGAAS
jgi:class 3 adenylate cyclase